MLANGTRESYRSLFDAAPCAYIVMQLDGTIFQANDAFWRLTGLAPGADSNTNFRSLLSSAGAIFYDSQLLPPLLLNGVRNEVALDLRLKSGRKPVLANFCLQHEGETPTAIRAILFEASERREYERNLLRARREAEQLSEVVAHSTDAIITLRPGGEVRNWNQGASDMFGYTAFEAADQSISRLLFRDAGRATFEAAMDGLASGKEHSGNFVGFRKEGSGIELSVKLTPHMEAPGTLVAFSAVLRDITIQKKAEHALLQSEKLASVGRLASSIAHEINNPLEAVTNLLYILDFQVTTSEQKALIQSAQEELARVSQIATHTLRFYRQSSSSTEVDLSKLIQSVLALYKAKLANFSVTVTIGRCDAEPLLCHEGELRQILLNLIGNAVDAMKFGGTLSLRCREATAWISNERGVRITIGDNGTGMDKATVAKIFEPFFSTKGIGGTGLGLWVTHDLVDNNRGKIAVKSTTSAACRGTVFTLFFPHKGLSVKL